MVNYSKQKTLRSILRNDDIIQKRLGEMEKENPSPSNKYWISPSLEEDTYFMDREETEHIEQVPQKSIAGLDPIQLRLYEMENENPSLNEHEQSLEKNFDDDFYFIARAIIEKIEQVPQKSMVAPESWNDEIMQKDKRFNPYLVGLMSLSAFVGSAILGAYFPKEEIKEYLLPTMILKTVTGNYSKESKGQ